jgi:hypothetical protein
LYYYPHLNQWASFYGGLFMVIGNTIWILQVIWYLTRAKRSKHKKGASS